MPQIKVNDIDIFYEVKGNGKPFVFIHGAFVSSTMWNPQVSYFSENYETVVYDIRGHGKTGSSEKKKYSVELYADDLAHFLGSLGIQKPIICGLSLGGMIAQVFATKYPAQLAALIVSDTAVTITLTWWDYIMRYLVGPKWLMLLSLKMIGVPRFIRFSFWLAKFTRSKEWLGNEEIIEYERKEMIRLDKKEYLKIFGSLYDFKLQPLEKVRVPTLVLNGQYEPKSLFKHAQKMEELISDCEIDKIPNAGHVTNLENIHDFNQRIESFLKAKGIE
ncbi:MAG: alpha/beta fold hydrolase [Candidatus Heimdallarchaeota archaeon]